MNTVNRSVQEWVHALDKRNQIWGILSPSQDGSHQETTFLEWSLGAWITPPTEQSSVNTVHVRKPTFFRASVLMDQWNQLKNETESIFGNSVQQSKGTDFLLDGLRFRIMEDGSLSCYQDKIGGVLQVGPHSAFRMISNTIRKVGDFPSRQSYDGRRAFQTWSWNIGGNQSLQFRKQVSEEGSEWYSIHWFWSIQTQYISNEIWNEWNRWVSRCNCLATPSPLQPIF